MESDKMRKYVQLATLYNLRLKIKTSGKDSFTNEEICTFVDAFANEIAQERE